MTRSPFRNCCEPASTFRRAILTRGGIMGLLAFCAVAPFQPTFAQQPAPQQPAPKTVIPLVPLPPAPPTPALPVVPPVLDLVVSQGQMVNLPGAASSLIVADPDIANAQIPLPNKIFVFGRKPGTTTIYALSGDGEQLAAIQVNVSNDTTQIRKSLQRVPNPAAVSAAGNPTGFTVQGSVPNPSAAAQIIQAANAGLQNGEKLTDQIEVRNSAQVMIQVRIAEVSRTVMKQLGFNWNAVGSPIGNFNLGLYSGRTTFTAPPSTTSTTSGTGGSSSTTSSTAAVFLPVGNGAGSLIANYTSGNFNFQNVIDALASDGLVTVLAEPSLVALSGQPASFLVGGEFPIPIAQAGSSSGTSVTIQFKSFGVSLNFVPTVYSDNHINIHIRPEVSQLTDAGSITLNGTVIPALQVRRAETTVELGSGQSFALAGLLQNNITSTVAKYPGLGDLPILGALFRSSSFQRNETELVIIATPYIVKPVDDPSKLSLPTDGLRPASDVEQMLLGRLISAPGVNPGPGLQPGVPGLTTPRLVGDAGFSLK